MNVDTKFVIPSQKYSSRWSSGGGHAGAEERGVSPTKTGSLVQQSSAETSGFGSFDTAAPPPCTRSLENISIVPGSDQHVDYLAKCTKKAHSFRQSLLNKQNIFSLHFRKETPSNSENKMVSSVSVQDVVDSNIEDASSPKDRRVVKNQNRQIMEELRTENLSPLSSPVLEPTAGHSKSPSRDSIRSMSSAGSARHKSRPRLSAWIQWQHDRRASFKRRKKQWEERQIEEERYKLSTPVKKARKESLHFLSKDLATAYLPEDQIDADEQMNKSCRLSRPSTFSTGIKHKKMTDQEVESLTKFFEHKSFIRSRYTALFLAMLGFGMCVVSLTNKSWAVFTDNNNSTRYMGLWQNCTTGKDDDDTVERCHTTHGNWQNAVIGLLMFSLGFGSIATILGVLGVVAKQLPKKIYYYHSAGEIYLICALAAISGLVTYPIALGSVHDMPTHKLGLGYGLGWGACFFYLFAAICMSLDDIVRFTARKIPGCCKLFGQRDNVEHV